MYAQVKAHTLSRYHILQLSVFVVEQISMKKLCTWSSWIIYIYIDDICVFTFYLMISWADVMVL